MTRGNDRLLALGAFGALFVNLVLMWDDGRAPWPVGVLLTAVACGALAFRRVQPLAVVAVTGLASILYYPMGFPDTFLAMTFLFAMLTLAAEAGRLTALLASLAIIVGFVVAGRLRHAGFAAHGEDIAGVTGMLLLAVILGEVQRSRQQAVRRAEEALRTRDDEARLRVTEERLRIARELHDVLAHQISLINVQAGAALHRRDAEQAFTALENIKAASKETLRELRGVLGVLRQYDEESAPVGPVPSLDALETLVAQTTASGVRVRLEESGDETIPAPVSLAAFRIVQEALTNVVRHAGASSAVVEVRRKPGRITVTVTDDGTVTPSAEDLARGNGLRGMRERAAAVGGTVTATPLAGGFTVRADFLFRSEETP